MQQPIKRRITVVCLPSLAADLRLPRAQCGVLCYDTVDMILKSSTLFRNAQQPRCPYAANLERRGLAARPEH